LIIDDKKYALPDSQYFKEAQKKTQIVLHFTAGSTASGAYQSWMQSPVQVATAFIVDKSGIVYQCFEPQYWAYHLGIQGADGRHQCDKQSIGIEIVNEGPLKLVNGKYLWWPDDFKTEYTGSTVCCTPGYRGFDFYADFTRPQEASVCELTKRLCQLFDIKEKVYPKINDFAFPDVMDFSGITTHANYRKDKFDIGPAWSWKEFEFAVNQ
jgi:N-acetyl-anhydromuramyl-L-alanine amidase AmpD